MNSVGLAKKAKADSKLISFRSAPVGLHVPSLACWLADSLLPWAFLRALWAAAVMCTKAQLSQSCPWCINSMYDDKSLCWCSDVTKPWGSNLWQEHTLECPLSLSSVGGWWCSERLQHTVLEWLTENPSSHHWVAPSTAVFWGLCRQSALTDLLFICSNLLWPPHHDHLLRVCWKLSLLLKGSVVFCFSCTLNL